MTKIEEYQLLLIKLLAQNGIKRMVYTSSVRNSFFVENACKSMDCYEYEDARSVAYIGTGMAAESNESVVICTNGDVEYRSFCSGLTEAFYRNLQIVAITISDHIKLDYSIEIKDTVKYHQRISGRMTEQEMINCIYKVIKGKKPCHLDIDLLENQECVETKNEIATRNGISHPLINVNWLGDIIPENCTLFIGNCFDFQQKQFKCVSSASIAGGYEGVLARVLGASLCGGKERYIGLVTEKEFIHDINSLGNRCINNKVVYIVYTRQKKDTVINYASALSFICLSIKEGDKLPEFPDAPVLLTVDSK